jgi:HlyD family secretion protein
MKLKPRHWLPPLLLLLLAIVALVLWQRSRSEQEPLRLYGNVDIREVELAFRQSGRLARLHVDEGVEVQAGALLAELDAEPLREQVAAAQAARRAAAAELARVQKGSRPQEIVQAEQALTQARTQAEVAAREYARQAELQAQRLTSAQRADAAREARDVAQSAVRAAEATLALRREGFRSEEIDAAQARLDGADAALAQASTALADAELKAPADAIVQARLREPGSMVGPNAPVLVLSLPRPVYVRAYIEGPQLAEVAPGTALRVLTDAGDEYRGRVGFVSPRAEFTPKSVETEALRTDLVYRLRIVVENPDERLRQGMPVTLEALPADGQGG